MDAGALLTQAIEGSRLSLTDFARRGRTSRSAVWGYLSGDVSPTVGTLNRLLAGVGLQVRATLEPLLADVDERVDALLAGTPRVDLTGLESTARSFAQDHGQGPVAWAVDGPSALNLHGLAVQHPFPTVVVRLDDAWRLWMFRNLMRTTTPVDDIGSWLSWDLAEVQASLRGLVVGRGGMLQMRAVEELPHVVALRPEGSKLEMPVVTVDEVERTRPELAEVLARWRVRR